MIVDIRLLIKQISEKDDRNAFEKLHRIYFPRCHSFAFYFTKSNELSEEVVSDVFLNLWQNRTLLPAIQHFDSYLYISVRNQALLYLAQARKRNQVSLDTLMADVFAEEDDPESRLLNKELLQIIQRAINRLPEKCRMIYVMVKEEKMSYKQVAEVLRLSERTVNTQMTLALKKLGVMIRHFFDQEAKQIKKV